ncbi:MAG TPA: polyketide synthase dehydratase domain-containing protein, partial [Candidatus Udaeobacter sp.]|nr:polyketide synthase dehydratase domain-containing protein [Candidatus Udaeobacter sp.]
VDWAALVAGTGRQVVLPTYPFQRQRFWLDAAAPAEVSGVGLDSVEHPMLGAVVEVPESGGVVVSGRVSLGLHPWLADHVVSGVVLVPGAVLVEWAIQAGDRVGCSVVEELVVESPMRLGESGVLRVRLSVGELDQTGRRAVGIYSRVEGEQSDWSRHAQGYLGPDTPGDRVDGGVAGPGGAGWELWPPVGAVAVEVGEFYDRLAGRGYDYGPVFQGLRAGWMRGSELFAEVALPDQVDAHGFAIHPALLDAALHTGLLASDAGADTASAPGDGAGVVVPFVWNQVVLHASGARVLRVRVVPGPSGVSVQMADPSGAPVLSLGSLISRPIALDQLTAGADRDRDALFEIEWTSLPGLTATTAQPVRVAVISGVQDLATVVGAAEGSPPWVVLRPGPGPEAISDPDRARVVINQVLEVVQAFLSEAACQASHLVIATQHGVAVEPGEMVDPVACAVWGLIRSAQTENPDRILLTDLDTTPETFTDTLPTVLAALVTAGEGQYALRGESIRVPRLTPASHD